MKLAQLAEQTSATIEQGSPELEIASTAGMDIAGPADITFLANPKYIHQLKTTRAGAVYLNEGIDVGRTDIAVLRAKDSYLAYTRAMRLFFPQPEVEPFVHPTAVIHPTANVARFVEIHANAVIGANCVIAAGVRIMPNVTLYDGVSIGENTIIDSGVAIRGNCEIGANCVIQNNATIGSDGFGYAKDENGRWLKIPQTGRVVLEDDVEIGANTAIDCASVGETRIKRGAKIDNLVQIGHNVVLGRGCILAGQVGISGSTRLGDFVMAGGQAGLAGHLRIGSGARIAAKSGLMRDVEPGATVSGIPAVPIGLFMKQVAVLQRLARKKDGG